MQAAVATPLRRFEDLPGPRGWPVLATCLKGGADLSIKRSNTGAGSSAHWRWIRLPADRKLERSVAALKLVVETFMAQAHGRVGVVSDLRRLGSLLEATIGASGHAEAAMDDSDIAGNIATMLFAGNESEVDDH
jgi:cytochrome P450